jgi:ribosomal protein S12 methylthiotransferase
VDAHDGEGGIIARSSADAPEIDGVVLIEEGAALPVGEFAEVRIVDADEHDLYAEWSPQKGKRWDCSQAPGLG